MSVNVFFGIGATTRSRRVIHCLLYAGTLSLWIAMCLWIKLRKSQSWIQERKKLYFYYFILFLWKIIIIGWRESFKIRLIFFTSVFFLLGCFIEIWHFKTGWEAASFTTHKWKNLARCWLQVNFLLTDNQYGQIYRYTLYFSVFCFMAIIIMSLRLAVF